MSKARREAQELAEAKEIAQRLALQHALSVRRIVRALYAIYPNNPRPLRAAPWLLNALGCLPNYGIKPK